jgi:hypothetical protein
MEIFTNKDLLTNLDDREKTAIQWQRRILIVTYIVAIPLVGLSMLLFHTMLYGFIAACIPAYIISILSMTSRISIFRFRGQKELPRGNQAVLTGLGLMVCQTIGIIVAFQFFPVE